MLERKTIFRTVLFSLLFVSCSCFIVLRAVSAQNYDFHAFYCAGAVSREGGNPYHAAPMRDCEMHRTDAAFGTRMGSTVLPAPFPGYVIAPMRPISRLPFAIASKLWSVVLLLATVVAIVALCALSGAGVLTVLAAFCLSVGISSIGFGEIVPLYLAAVALAALWAHQERWLLASGAATMTLIEPHLGAPICVALFLWSPRTRFPLALGCLSLAALSLAAMGANANIEYLLRVLPFHALSEIGSDRQLSLAVIAQAAGLPSAGAVFAGWASYAVMVLSALYVSGKLYKANGNAAFVVAVPAAFAVIGGTFVHITQIVAALPLTFLLLRTKGAWDGVLIAAAVLIAIPWIWLLSPALQVAAAVVAFAITWNLTGRKIWVSVGAGAAVALFSMLLQYAPAAAGSAGTQVFAAAHIPSQYAEASWALANARELSTGSLEAWLARAPTWTGLLFVAAAALAAARRTVPYTGVRVRNLATMPVLGAGIPK